MLISFQTAPLINSDARSTDREDTSVIVEGNSRSGNGSRRASHDAHDHGVVRRARLHRRFVCGRHPRSDTDPHFRTWFVAPPCSSWSELLNAWIWTRRRNVDASGLLQYRNTRPNRTARKVFLEDWRMEQVWHHSSGQPKETGCQTLACGLYRQRFPNRKHPFD